jgi:RNA polymerase sigma factor (sigma-70 family)
MSLHHHNPHYIGSLEADRRARAGRRRVPADPAQLERVVRAAAQGDACAWLTLVERFGARMRVAARSYGLAAHDVEDVVQTTWLRLLEHIQSVRDPRALGAWLETTARNESVRLVRAGARERPADEYTDQRWCPSVDAERLIADDRRAAVARACQRLPRKQKYLLAMLFARSEPSYEEISRILRIPIGSIGPTRARSLSRLRRDAEFATTLEALR